MFSLNGTCVIFIFLFMIFVQLLNKIMLQPVGEAIEKRKARLKSDTDASKAYMQESDQLLSHYQEKLHASRLQAQGLIQTALIETQKDRDEKLKSVQAEGRQKIEVMKAELASGRKELIDSLVHPELDLVRSIMHKLLGETPNLVTSEKRVSEVLEKGS